MRCYDVLKYCLKSHIPSPTPASVFLSNDTWVEMLLSQCHLLHSKIPNIEKNNPFRNQYQLQFQPNKLTSPLLLSSSSPKFRIRAMSSSSSPPHQLNHFSDVANKAANAAGDVIRKYFRKNNFDIIHKNDLSK